MIKMRRERVSFLGDLIIIIIIVLFAFLFLNQFKQNNINEIKTINEKYGVTSQILVPTNQNEYVMELSNVKEKEITNNLIEFIKFNQELNFIENSIKRGTVVKEDCISRDLKLRINSVTIKINGLIKNFEEINSKKNEPLNISQYITFLKNVKEKYMKYKIDADTLDVCK
jgi:hypothetical protein